MIRLIRWSMTLTLVVLLFLPPHPAAGQEDPRRTKVGFIWAAQLAPCSTDQATAWYPSAVQPNPTGRVFYLESLRIFTGISDPGITGQSDALVQVKTYSGQIIEIVPADKYVSPAGPPDVVTLRSYATPWRFKPHQGVVVDAYCHHWGWPAASGSGSAGGQWFHYWVAVEGYVE